MAAPQDSPEQAFRLRKFQGTNTDIDSLFLGPSYLTMSENWIPAQSYRLGKRPGSRLVVSLSSTLLSHLLATHALDGTPYLYAGSPTPSSQVIEVKNESVIATQATFSTAGPTVRSIAFRDRVYAGNGVDPLVSWKLGDPPANNQVYAAITNLGGAGAPTITSATGANLGMPTGTYSYAWGRFDSQTGLYTGRTDPGTFAVDVGQTVVFTSPAATLGANEKYRLFVSPRNYPIEYATLQATDLGASAATKSFSTFDVSDDRVPMAGGTNVFRSGNMFVVWRNRLVFAGFSQDPYSVFATDVMLPGLEQTSFNIGTMFPSFAKVRLPAAVTGIGVAGVTTDQAASAPLLFFTATRTFLCSGDPFDPDGEAVLEEVSSRVGCVGHDSIVNTPVGTIFVGVDSVYLIPPGGGYPQDIGWPIADHIRNLSPNYRSKIVATFHKQFYKLALPAGAGSVNTDQWWLDLRAGIDPTPSWWGPHVGQTATAMCADPAATSEIDRGYTALLAQSGTVPVIATHQLGVFTDFNPANPASPTPIRSRLQSGRFDADQPFIVKIFTRIRLIAQSAAKTALHVTMVTDGGKPWNIEPILLSQDLEPPGQFVHLTPIPGGPPPNKAWATATLRGRATFGTISPAEAQTITPYARPRGLSVIVMLVHDPALDAHDADPSTNPSFADIQLRDFELLFLFSERKVRFLNEGISR